MILYCAFYRFLIHHFIDPKKIPENSLTFSCSTVVSPLKIAFFVISSFKGMHPAITCIATVDDVLQARVIGIKSFFWIEFKILSTCEWDTLSDQAIAPYTITGKYKPLYNIE